MYLRNVNNIGHIHTAEQPKNKITAFKSKFCNEDELDCACFTDLTQAFSCFKRNAVCSLRQAALRRRTFFHTNHTQPATTCRGTLSWMATNVLAVTKGAHVQHLQRHCISSDRCHTSGSGISRNVNFLNNETRLKFPYMCVCVYI